MNSKVLMRCTAIGCLAWAGTIACLWRPAFAAYAGPSSPAPTGLFAMDTGNTQQAVDMSGSSTLIADGVYVNSSNANALKTSGSAKVTARNIMIVGNASWGSNPGYSGTLTCGCAAAIDPCSGVSIPTSSGMTDKGTINSSSSITVSPGYYSGGLSISGGTMTLQPGLYILGNGLSVSSSSVVGEGVTIVVQGGKVNFSGSASASLNVNTPAPLSGVTIAQPASNTNKLTLSGGASFVIGGIIYAKGAQADLSGSSTAAGQGPTFGESFICKTVTLSGSASIKIGRGSGAAVPLPTASTPMD
jgi:hypothetical protein